VLDLLFDQKLGDELPRFWGSQNWGDLTRQTDFLLKYFFEINSIDFM
jgi:hypothetical protein